MSLTREAVLDPLAEIANAAIRTDCPALLGLLSERGKRFFFPTKGILAQGADVPIPISLDWSPVLLLTILWIFVAAAIAGPLLRRFRP